MSQQKNSTKKREISNKLAALWLSLSMVVGGAGGALVSQPGDRMQGWMVKDGSLIKVMMEVPNQRWTTDQLLDYRGRLDKMSAIIDSVITLRMELDELE